MLLLGIFVGINTAEKNMQQMQGTEGAPRAIQITPHDGKVEITVLGEVVETKRPVVNIDTENIQIVKEEVRQGTNYLAIWSNMIGSGMRNITRQWVEWLFGWIEELP